MQKGRVSLLTGVGVVLLVVCLATSGVLWDRIRGMQANISRLSRELAIEQQDLDGALASIGGLRVSMENEAIAHSSSIAGLEGKLDGAAAALQKADVPGLRRDLEATQRGANSVMSAVRTLSESVDQEATVFASSIAGVKDEVYTVSTALREMQADLAALDSQSAAASAGRLRIAYLNADDAFSVFTNAVSSLRQKAVDKRNEIVKLQGDFMQSTISKDQYQRRLNELNVQLIEAQLDIDVGTIARMIASEGFADIRADLQKLRDAAQPVVEEVKNLVATAKLGVADAAEFQSRLTQVQSAFQQLDTLLTQAATLKIQQAAKKIALQKGYDLVIPTKNVIVYVNQSALPDITEAVKAEVAYYL